jgi:hypothetical protein
MTPPLSGRDCPQNAPVFRVLATDWLRPKQPSEGQRVLVLSVDLLYASRQKGPESSHLSAPGASDTSLRQPGDIRANTSLADYAPIKQQPRGSASRFERRRLCILVSWQPGLGLRE